jgi:hypothetical protein
VPSNWLSIVVLLLCFAPGWLAMAGWCRGRNAPGPHRALGDGVPAVALSAAWTGPLALLAGPTFIASWLGARSVGQAALLLVVLAVLLGVPALLGFVTARVTRSTASEPVLAPRGSAMGRSCAGGRDRRAALWPAGGRSRMPR